jgi:hypothetical protein
MNNIAHEFDEHMEPQDRGNPLDAVSRDAEPRDDSGDADSSTLASDLAREFRGDKITEASAPEILLFLRERGVIAGQGSRRTIPRGMDYDALMHLKEIFAEQHHANTSIKKWAVCHVLKGRIVCLGDLTHGWTQKQFADWLCDAKNPNKEYQRVTKQNINKVVKFYYAWFTAMGLAIPLPEGMRQPVSCEKMSAAALERMREEIKEI